MAAHNDLGKWGEERAADYLQRKGYRIVARNWKSGHRDIDIIAMDGDEYDGTVVFVEVKTRRNRLFAEPEEAVDWRKMRNLVFAANTYVQRMGIFLGVRFDIITVVGEGDNVQIEHIENAFVPPMNMR